MERDPQGRVLQVNMSGGGVPKSPVERAWVGRLGLDGDAHRERTVHGGPHRAVCLFSIEAIERLQSEGHPVEPGSVGENLTTAGVEWSLLPVGTRARIGDQLELELASSTTPCSTQKPNFLGGRFSRISIALHPSDSRMYARVLREGEVRPGDPITILPAAPDSHAEDELLLEQLDWAETRSSLAAWHIARRAGFDVRIVDDGELAMVAAPRSPGPAYNSARGLARLPNLVGEATRFFDDQRTIGWLTTEAAPWPGSVPDLVLGAFAAEPSAVGQASTPTGVRIRRLGAGETERWDEVFAATGSGGVDAAGSSPWPAVAAGLVEHPHAHLLLAEIDGQPVGAGMLYVSRRTGWLRAGAVVPAARGRGIQRALIAARVRLALEQRCELVGSTAELGSVSARNLGRMGFRQIGRREQHRYVPPGVEP
ncbi:MAG: GNAT family N-acetyltransferase [Chloroflexota bacterium]|nr:GNAT family N-acetyltransferase [Chloroflexota bacterium]